MALSMGTEVPQLCIDQGIQWPARSDRDGTDGLGRTPFTTPESLVVSGYNSLNGSRFQKFEHVK